MTHIQTLGGLSQAALDSTYARLVGVQPTRTTDGAVVASSHNPVDATSGNRTVTLADAASAGLLVAVSKKDASANTVTVSVAHLRDGGAGSITLVGQYEALLLASKADGTWWPVGDHKTKAYLDAVYKTPTDNLRSLSDSTFLTGLSNAFVARWAASTAYTAGDLRLAPDGTIIQRNANGTSRATYDTTEQAAWTVRTGAGGSALTDVAATATTSGALTAGKHNPVDATSANLTMTLADATGAGQLVSASKKDSSTNTVTVSVAHLRDGGAGTITLVGQYEALLLASKADGSWWPIGDHKTKGYLDGAYSRTTTYARDVVAPLNIPSYNGTNAATHPSVVRAPNGVWNGHRYWMAYTPYPDTTIENPCILVSENGSDWVAPDGLTNPVRPQSFATSRGYASNSDPELLLVNNVLHLYFRIYKDTGSPQGEEIWRITSTDGINWGNDTQVLVSSGNSLTLVSPTIVQESGNNFSMWVVNEVTTNGHKITRYSSTDGGLTWGSPTDCAIAAGHHPHHIMVRKVGGTGVTKYALLSVDNDQTKAAVMMFSTDGLTWDGDTGYTFPKSGDTWDASYFYRSAFLPAPGGRYDLWMSGVPNPATKYTLSFYPNYDWVGQAAENRRRRAIAALAGYDQYSIIDGFQRSSWFGIGYPDLGPLWQQSGLVSSSVRISTSNTLQMGVGNAGTGLHLYGDGGSANGTVSCDVIPTATADVGLIIRRVDANNFIYLAISGSGDQLRIRKYDTGALTTLATYTPAGIVAGAGKRFNITFKADGTALSVTLNGASVLTYTLTTAEQTKYGSATVVGFWAWGDNVSQFDNYSYKKLL